MKYLHLIIILICLPFVTVAQKENRSWEIPLFLGTTNYIGDLSPDICVKESRMVIGTGIKRNFNGYFSAALMLNFGIISGNDANFKSLAPRNLEFQSQIFEFGPQFEFNFFRLSNNFKGNRFSPYLYTGFAVFHFDPIAHFQDKTFHLQQYSTEGQGLTDNSPKPYSLWNVAIPIGAGFKYKITSQWMLALHGAFRTTFTDYLDDVSGIYTDKMVLEDKKGAIAVALSDRSGEKSGEFIGNKGFQRGSRDTDDWYIFAGFTLSYILQKSNCYSF